MRRREFISLLGGAAVLWPLAANGQSDRVRRVGVLMGYAETDPAAQAQVAALRQELQKLGWEEGRNIRIDVRFPAADAGRGSYRRCSGHATSPSGRISPT
jgi:putative ABC transport system substrate-binding protein